METSILSPIFLLLGSITTFTLIFLIIAKIEQGRKVNKLFQKTENLLYVSFGLFISIVILFFILRYNNVLRGSTLNYIVLFVLKIIISSFVASEAKKQNRSFGLWFLLSFIEFHSALIALAIGKNIYKAPNGSKLLFEDLNNDYKEKVESLKELCHSVRKSDNSFAITSEYEIPLKKIKEEYSSKFEAMFKKQQKEEYVNTSLKKIKRAYEAGIITENDYKTKISKLKINDKL